jgi:GYF domain 2
MARLVPRWTCSPVRESNVNWGGRSSVAGMCAQPVDKHWFISLKGKRYGPYTFAALTEAADKGVIDADTNVWRLGWVKWHPARSVPGLLNDPSEQEDAVQDDSVREAPARQDHAREDSTREGSGNDFGPGGQQPRQRDDHGDAPGLTDDLPPENHGPPSNAPGRSQRPAWQDDDAPRTAPGLIDEQPLQDEDMPRGALPSLSEQPAKPTDRGADITAVPQVPPQLRDELAEPPPTGPPARRWGRRAALGLLTVTVLAGAGWGLFYSGLIVAVAPSSNQVAESTPPRPQPQSEPAEPERGPPPALAAGNGLPAAVAALPAVMTIERNDPAVFERFRKRFVESAANVADDQILSLARAVLRKSVRGLLANAPGDTLVEITGAYVGYMQALQFSSPESCVALSDESKGAKLTSNLAKEFPALFARDMAVLDRVAGNGPGAAIAPLTAEQARPYLDMVFNSLRQQPLQNELLRRVKLTPAEFLPYCNLVIAFYETVLALPSEDRTNLLRYLYAAAAADPDDDVAK